MRYFMVDPENEERLLKIPYYVRTAIRAEAIKECITLVGSIPDNDDGDVRYVLVDVTARLHDLLKDRVPPPLPASVGVPERKGGL